MVDPSRLVASARRAWGAASDTLWGPIVPVPAGRLVPLEGGERFPLQGGELHVVATPGHARHHLAFSDTACHALLTGDAAGVRLAGMASARPAVPPPDLDLERLFESLATMEREGFTELWYSHFGPVTGGAADLESYRRSVERWRDVALQTAQSDPTVPAITRALRELDASTHIEVDPSNVPRQEMISGYELAAQGLLRYLRARGTIPPDPARSGSISSV
jgi:glyoxylase-like metal-dependent hydrolase (beta-lactamase superfamily II)